MPEGDQEIVKVQEVSQVTREEILKDFTHAEQAVIMSVPAACRGVLPGHLVHLLHLHNFLISFRQSPKLPTGSITAKAGDILRSLTMPTLRFYNVLQSKANSSWPGVVSPDGASAAR